MKQDIIQDTQPSTGPSFAQKSTGLSLVIVFSAALYYIVNMWPMRDVAQTTAELPAGFGSLVLTTIGLIVMAEIVLQIVLAVGAGADSAESKIDRIATLKATRNAYFVLCFAIFAAVGTVFMPELTPFCTANVAILGFVAAEIVGFISQLIYSR